MIAVSINDPGVRLKIRDLLTQAKRPRAVLAAMGREGQQQLKRHFRGKDRTESNRLGGKRTHFWRQVADSVQAPMVQGDTSVTISVNHPAIAQKVLGGTIRAKRAKMLTIPVSPEAYGRTASTFEHETGLKLIFLKAGNNALLATRRSQDSKALQIEYILTPSVEQAPDPTALPDMKPASDFVRALIARGQAVVDRQNKTP